VLQQVALHQQEIDFLSQRQPQVEQLIATAQRHRLGRERLLEELRRLAPQAYQLDLEQGRAAARVETLRQTIDQATETHEQRLEALEAELSLTLRQIGATEARIEQGERWSDHYDRQPLSQWQQAYQLYQPEAGREDATGRADLVPHLAHASLQTARDLYQRRRQEIWPALEQAQRRAQALREDLMALCRQPLPEAQLNDEVLAAREIYARQQSAWQQHEAQQQRLDQQRQQALQAIAEQQAGAEAAYRARLQKLEAEQKAVQERLKQSSQSFMAWLDGRYPDWQKSIGKVVREEVLMHPYLSPSIERLNDLLFGIQLDLSELEEPVLGTQRLQEENDRLVQVGEETKEAWQREQQDFARQQQNAEKRFRQKANLLAREGQQLRYRVEQARQQEHRLRQRLREQQQQARQRREQQLLALSYRLEAEQSEVAQQQAQLSETEAGWEMAWQAWTSAQTLPAAAAVPKTEDEPEPVESGSGDGEQAQAWLCYRRDYQQWIAPLDTWRSALARLRQREIRLRADRQRQVDQWPQRLAAWQEELASAQVLSERVAETASIWEHLRPWSPKPDPTPSGATALSAEDLVEALQAAGRALDDLQAQAEQLRREAQAIGAGLSPDNVLRLPVELGTAEDCEALADQLAEIMGHDRWNQVQQELAGRHAPLLARLAHQVAGFDQDAQLAGRVQRTQRALSQQSFPGDVQQLRLRLLPGEQPLARALRALLDFAETHGSALGDGSLFRQGSNHDVDQEALGQLMQLHRALTSWEGDTLPLADVFCVEIEVLLRGSDSWQPWQPWADSETVTGALWQALLLAVWAAEQVPGQPVLPLRLEEPGMASLLLALAQAGGLTPLLTQSWLGLGDKVSTQYQWQSRGERVEAKLVMG